MDKAMRPPPSAELLSQMEAEGKALGDVPYQQNGTISFEFFLETTKIVTKYVYLYSKDGLEEDKLKRREFVAASKEPEFLKLIQLNMAWQEKTNGFMKARLYTALKVPKDVLNKSAHAYMQDAANRETFYNALGALRDELSGQQPQDLTRDQCLDFVRRIEAAKFADQQRLHELVVNKKIASHMIGMYVKCSKIKEFDTIFNETGVEQEDINRSMKKLNLLEDEEFKTIIAESKKKSEEFLASKKDETASMMQAAATGDAQE